MRKLVAVSLEEIQRRFADEKLFGANCPFKDDNPFKDFVNTIIFPQKGRVPITAQISGGDLDGDLYFMTWEPSLIPKNDVPAFEYDQDKNKKSTFNGSDEKAMLDFFVEYMNYESLGKIDNSHLALADQSENLANDPICMKLAVSYPPQPGGGGGLCLYSSGLSRESATAVLSVRVRYPRRVAATISTSLPSRFLVLLFA